jgi:cell division protein FtsQ
MPNAPRPADADAAPDAPASFGGPRAWAWAMGAGLALAALAAVAWFGLRWDADTPVARLAVTGAHHAHPDSLRALARLDTGLTMGAVEPLLVADRVRQHPWVADVGVTRRPGGVVALAVTERTPAALALDPEGRPAAYLDRDGFALPLPDTLDADVPVVRPAVPLRAGALPRTRPAVGPAVTAALRALHRQPAAHALAAELLARPDSTVRLVTRPAPGTRAALVVRLGRDGPGADAYRAKLRRLDAFWQQVLAPRAAAPPAIREIDLRFDDHILTRS